MSLNKALYSKGCCSLLSNSRDCINIKRVTYVLVLKRPETCRKLGISFWEYLNDRLAQEKVIPELSEQVIRKARAASGYRIRTQKPVNDNPIDHGNRMSG